MKKILLFAPIAASLLMSACGPSAPPTVGDLQPFRSEWLTVANWPFVAGEIQELNVGGTLQSDNYANRGDVEVFYTLPDDRIVVQMRKFTFAASLDEAQGDFDRTVPWMYALGTPSPPADIEASDPSANCQYADPATGQALAAWPDGCSIRVYFEGQSQKLRVGADIRVFLPTAWEGTLNVTTQDNVAQIDDYPDRGDVTVLGLRGTSTINVDSAEVMIRLADETEPSPVCTESQNADCDAAGWDPMDPTCNCQVFGRVSVETRGEQPVNVTIDAPSNLWANATLDNTQPGLTPSSVPECTATIDCDGFGGCNFIENDDLTPWRRRVELNKPANSLEGAGFNMKLESGACAEIEVANGPEDYEMPTVEKRGDTVLCTGCLADVMAPAAP